MFAPLPLDSLRKDRRTLFHEPLSFSSSGSKAMRMDGMTFSYLSYSGSPHDQKTMATYL